ncbi:APC family permease [Fervidicoccus fontis]|uniref:APC family permease n=1 Tax=Fervidicoccus fontis TaxID=683846 RepID=A0A7C2Z9P0_9CREN|nr:APC family permease [Fervidicoccus fontis]HEW63515.1 APC family permease [Fervidicoccus fontis]
MSEKSEKNMEDLKNSTSTQYKDSKHYKKALGFWDNVMLNIGTMIGSGILLLPFVVAAYAGPYEWISWLVAGIFILPVILIYSLLVELYPVSGGMSRYPYYSHGGLVSFLASVNAIFYFSMIIIPIEAQAIVRYLNLFWPVLLEPSGYPTILGYTVEVILTVLVSVIVYFGVRSVSTSNFVITAIKLGLILLFGLTMFLFFWSPKNFTDPSIAVMPMGIPGIFAAAGASIFAYTGFRRTAIFAGESKEEIVKKLNWSEIVAWAIVLVVYVFMSVAIVGAIDWEKLAPIAAKMGINLYPGNWAGIANLSGPFAAIALGYGLIWMYYLFLLDGIISPFGVSIVEQGGLPRLFYAAAKAKYMPKAFLKVDKKTGTPIWGLIVSLIGEIVYLFVIRLYSQSVDVVVASSNILYATGPAAVIGILARKKIKSTLYSILAPVAMVSSSLIFYWATYPYTLWGTIALFLFLPLFIYYVAKGEARGDIKNGIWYLTYIIVLDIISYLGETTFGGKGILSFPWDFVVITIVALIFTYWAKISALKEEPEEAVDIEE